MWQNFQITVMKSVFLVEQDVQINKEFHKAFHLKYYQLLSFYKIFCRASSRSKNLHTLKNLENQTFASSHKLPSNSPDLYSLNFSSWGLLKGLISVNFHPKM
jgi:hypothetical protein